MFFPLCCHGNQSSVVNLRTKFGLTNEFVSIFANSLLQGFWTIHQASLILETFGIVSDDCDTIL